MDETYLLAAVRYVERNPVEAGLANKAEDYPWSSARAHIKGIKDPPLSEHFLTDKILDWDAYLHDTEDAEADNTFNRHSNTGRPLG